MPWVTYIFAIVAVIVVLLNREAMLSHTGAVTSVLFPGTEILPNPALLCPGPIPAA
jgi:hypothetical protein